jgi:hypothetical protein
MSTVVCGSFWGFKKFKMAAIGMATKEVSSISVRRVTCYDQFCVFNFFGILAVSMATAAILKNQPLKAHGI